ncbi:MAG: hypothetical protein M3Q69_11155 [Acidobacteriota bacterium]|nr:hypothetical protein [Acidobacteriota bacterium]
MKRFAAISLCVAALTAFAAGDVLQQLGISKPDAAREVLNAISSGHVTFNDRTRGVLRAASPDARAAIVEQGLVWLKAYVASPQFVQSYEAWRNQFKPQPFSTEGATAAEIAADKAQFKQDLAQWNQEYPPAREMIKRRLREFLKESANVDYAAKLVRSGKQMKFANEQYENERSNEWKLCYRAGKPAVEKARAFVQAWVGEMK